MQTPYAAARTGGRRRRLNDPIVRQQLVNPLINGGAAIYLHVIVTADQHNPLEDPEVQPLLPEIFINEQGANSWEVEKYRFGWTNWDGLWNLAQPWPAPPARFCGNLAFNLPYLFPPAAPGDGDEPPAGAAQGLPAGWPPGRPARGVSLIFAPAINQQTFLHFSWLRNSCRSRDYTQDPPPPPNGARSTMEVLGLKTCEEPCGARRPPSGNVGQWRAIIEGVNHRYGLGGKGGYVGSWDLCFLFLIDSSKVRPLLN